MLLDGVIFEGNVLLGEGSEIVKFTMADILEIEHYHNATINHPLFLPEADVFAVGYPIISDAPVKSFEVMLMALRLFKTGYVNAAIYLTFGRTNSNYSFQNAPEFRTKIVFEDEGEKNITRSGPAVEKEKLKPAFTLAAEEVADLQNWLKLFYEVYPLVQPNSVLARTLRRFERTYSGEDYERITDAIIGLETVFPQDNPTEITFRLALIVSQFTEKDSAKRPEILKFIKKCYGIRSKYVHETNIEKKTDNQTALEVQDILRQVIKFILQADVELRNCFFNADKASVTKLINFYNCLFTAGNYEQALRNWKQGISPAS